MSTQVHTIINRLKELGDKKIAKHSQKFFKTGKGEYGEGDRFLGIRVPMIRRCVKDYRELALAEIQKLLASPFHEARLLAVLILVSKYAVSNTEREKHAIYRLYLSQTDHINNWDLVDASAEHIVGAHLYLKDRKPIDRLAGSKSLWERRIAVMSTFYFIKREDYSETMHLAEKLLHDPEDLIHKAVGWMLREVGKRDITAEERFLAKHYRDMPRTMLRYAIEKLPENERKAYLKGTK